MSEGRLCLVPDAGTPEWNQLVTLSPQGTLFSEAAYLNATGRRHQLFFVTQGAEIKAGVALVLSDDGARCELDDLVIYGGILFNLDSARALVKRRHDEFQISEFVIEQLAARYDSVAVALSPAFEDMRPVLWHGYLDEGAPRFSLDLRYTSYLDVSCLRTFDGREEASPLFAGMETVRRYSVRQAHRDGGRVVRGESSQTLVDFYRDLMVRQSQPPRETTLAAMRRVMEMLLAGGRGALYETRDATGAPLYSVFYGWDSKRAYYLFGAGNPDVEAPWQGTLAHWGAFKDLAQRVGISEVDLEGVNSPRRGWFKLGLGGDLRPYYQIRNAT